MTQLPDLPVELLQRIARELPCSSALAFSRVSRKLHSACYDRLVFRYIALHAMDKYSYSFGKLNLRKLSEESVTWPEGPDLLEQATIDEIVRMAYAVEQALRRALEGFGVLRNDSTDLVRLVYPAVSHWLPHLLAWHYPAHSASHILPLSLAHLDTASKLDETRPSGVSNVQDEANFTNIGFCVAFLALHYLAPDSDYFMITEQIPMGYSDSMCWGIRRFDDRKMEYDMAQASAIVLPMLQCMGDGLYFERSFRLPIPSKIPFSSMMSKTNVFCGDSQRFSICHVERMTEPAFLNGEWVGCYVDQRWGQDGYDLVEPPMQFRMVTTNARQADHARPDLRGYIVGQTSHGSDSVGPFTISGEILESGHINMVKTYIQQGWEWNYRGVVVPFGITGFWTNNRFDFGGHFWFWKKEWCDFSS